MRLPILCLAALALATPAFAQIDDAAPRDTVTIAVGPAAAPRYEGSADYQIIGAAALRGKISGIGFTTLGTGVFVDLLPSDGNGFKFIIGPMAHVTLNRSSLKTTRDPRIVALGRVPVAVELGGHFGLSKTGVITSAYDTASLDVAISHDVTGIHDSLIVTPSFNYGTPLSRKAFVGANISANYVGRGYAQTYFGVTPAQSVASGLARTTPGKGFKDIGIGLVTTVSLTGDLRHGLSAFAVGNAAKLLGDFARSPIVRDRNQYFGGIGLAYTF